MENSGGSVPRRVGYVFNRQLLYLVNQLPEVGSRALMVHQLIAAYGLLSSCRKIDVKPASDQELRKFHTEEYIEFVREISTLERDDYDEATEERCGIFGLSYDCPPIPRLYDTIRYLAASSIAAAKAIAQKQCSIAINWFGGWHHGTRDEAAGFCYTNDIVFGILSLLEDNYRRILYIDLDLHHGDGVENSFAHSEKVLTLSMHKHEFGFYPGTGNISDVGGHLSHRNWSSINMPLADGLNDKQHIRIFANITDNLIRNYKPQVLVVQCGADGLSGDRMNSFNLTLDSYEQSIKRILATNIPVIFLGGGGYNFPNTARLWTLITALSLGKSLDESIPEHDFFLDYGPTYELPITASMIPNQNSEKAIAKNLEIISKKIDQINASD